MTNLLKAFIFLSLCNLILIGCNSSETTDSVNLPGSDSVAKMVVADEGGTINLDDGTRLVIPVGALSEDATVILSRKTCSGYLLNDNFGSCLYGVESSAILSGRIAIELPGHRPDSEQVCLMAKTDNGWRCLGDSSSNEETQKSQATSSNFTSFAIQTRSSQHQFMHNMGTDYPFIHCGGDIMGEWSLVFAVGTMEQLIGAFSTGPEKYTNCEPYEFNETKTLFMGENISFSTAPIESETYGSFNYQKQFNVYKHSVTTQSCLELYGNQCSSDVCVMESGICSCVINETSGETSGDSYLYLTDSGDISFSEQGDPLQYCVMGNMMAIEFYYSGTPYIMVYERNN
jgi:hypothetical protein